MCVLLCSSCCNCRYAFLGNNFKFDIWCIGFDRYNFSFVPFKASNEAADRIKAMNELKDDMEDLHSNLDDLNNWVDGANQEMDDVRRSIAAMDNTDGLLDSFKVSTGAGMGGVGWGYPWWRHQMETFSALLALCAGNSPVTGEFPSLRPVTRSFDFFFDLRLNNRYAGNLRRHRAHYDVAMMSMGIFDCPFY